MSVGVLQLFSITNICLFIKLFSNKMATEAPDWMPFLLLI